MVMDGYAIVFLYKRNGEVFECLVDLDSLELLKRYNKPWHTIHDKKLDSHYAKSTETYINSNNQRKQRTIYMHKFILNYSGNDKYIDHINHNTLDNRKNNLRIVNQSENKRNAGKIHKKNTSGYRNVSFINGKWAVQLQISGKNTKLGEFDDVHEAGEFARKMRRLYYGEITGD